MGSVTVAVTSHRLGLFIKQDFRESDEVICPNLLLVFAALTQSVIDLCKTLLHIN